MMTKDRGSCTRAWPYHTKFVNFMTPRVGLVVLGCSSISDVVNILNFTKKSSTLLLDIRKSIRWL